MNQESHNKLISFIWSIADDCLRDVYVRGKYRDVILPMVVLRRLDALLEPTKDAVLDEVKFQKEEVGLTELDSNGLKDASGYVFYNTSKWTLQKLHNTATNSQQMLEANFSEYLDGFSPNVKEIIQKFNLSSQIKHMASKDVLLEVLEKFTSPNINLTNQQKEDTEGKKLPPLTNLGMGYVFEELIRKFNEDNNEEAGEHFTPREVIDLMTHIIFDPIKDNLPPVMTIYDPACGSGGMLTESQKFITDVDGEIKAKGDVYLYGKEINDETYAICKSDMMIKGDNPQNIKNGSTLAVDEFSGVKFDFMLSNPPYGKSWSSDMKYIKDGKEIIDPRFVVRLKDYWGKENEADATPRSSDGQLLFLMEMVSKMKSTSSSPLGSRIASVHNGSSLFTGDDLIKTLRYDKTLIEPMKWAYKEFGKDIYKDIKSYEKEILEFCEKEEINLKAKQKKSLLSQTLWTKHQNYIDVANTLKEYIEEGISDDFNIFKVEVDKVLKKQNIKLSATEKNSILNAISWYDEDAIKVVKKVHKLSNDKLKTLLKHLKCKEDELENFGYYKTKNKNEYIEYEAHTDIRDSENIPLNDDIQSYFLKEVKPHVEEAWINLDSVKIGYEISFNKYFYKHKPLRSLEEVTKDILELESQSDGLIKEILGL